MNFGPLVEIIALIIILSQDTALRSRSRQPYAAAIQFWEIWVAKVHYSGHLSDKM